MNQLKLPAWLRNFVVSMGGIGIFAVAFLDSSVLSFPFVTDALVMGLSAQRPERMPYYAAMATIGSLAGCLWLYLLAKKGGEAFFHRHAGGAAIKAKEWVQNRAFLSVFIPAILPPPLPFKIFVVAGGAFQVRPRTFIGAILLGRGLRFFAEGILEVYYGAAALEFLAAHKWVFVILTAGALALIYFGSRWIIHGTFAED